MGFPSVGKSTLLNKLTGTFSEVCNPWKWSLFYLATLKWRWIDIRQILPASMDYRHSWDEVKNKRVHQKILFELRKKSYFDWSVRHENCVHVRSLFGQKIYIKKNWFVQIQCMMFYSTGYTTSYINFVSSKTKVLLRRILLYKKKRLLLLQLIFCNQWCHLYLLKCIYNCNNQLKIRLK